MRHFPIIVWSLSVLIADVFPQSNGGSIPGNFANDVSRSIRGTGYVLTSPLRWQGKDWFRFSAVLAGTFALSYADETVDDFFQRNHSSAADKLADIGVEYGEPRTVVITTGVVYLTGLVFDNEWLRDSAVILTSALLPAGGLQTATKYASGRARPHVGKGYDEFDPFHGGEDYFSFFSGHTLVTMATSHAYASRTRNVPVKIALYALGGVGGLARMYNEDHWLSDLVLGSVVGIVSVNSASRWLSAQKGSELGMRWQIRPLGRGAMLSLNW